MESMPTYSIEDEIEIKPRMKYEIVISLTNLQWNPDDNRFENWAKSMKEILSPRIYEDALLLTKHVNEWFLCSFTREYTAEDTIEGITSHLRSDPGERIRAWVQGKPALLSALNLQAVQFPEWYADFLSRYYREGFEASWESTYKNELLDNTRRLIAEFSNRKIDPILFMEQMTGRTFLGKREIVLYPSIFSTKTAYGFTEGGKQVVVHSASAGLKGVIGTIFHELLHTLLEGWATDSEQIKSLIADKTQNEAFNRGLKERLQENTYSYPYGWLDELAVHSFGHYLEYKAGFRSPSEFFFYNDYERELSKAILCMYQDFAGRIDDFLYYAMSHIHETKTYKANPGYSLGGSEGRLTVLGVKEQSVSYNAGVRARDEIVMMNGIEVNKDNWVKILEMLDKAENSPQSSSLQLGILRDNKDVLEIEVLYTPQESVIFEFKV